MRASLRWTVLGLILMSLHASGWPVAPRSDAAIFNDSTVVIVAKLKSGSLENLSYGGGYETKATLLISRVIKGNISTHELPIVLSYGTLPVPKHIVSANFGADGPHLPYSYNYSEPILLYEDNADGPTKFVNNDIRKENVWFLRPYRSALQISTGPGTYRERPMACRDLGCARFPRRTAAGKGSGI